MLPVQVLQQDVGVLFLALVPRHVGAPAPDGAGEPAGHVVLAGDLGDGVEVGADGEDDAAGLGQAAQRLPLGPEEVVLDGPVLLGRVPADAVAVLGADRVAPRELVVDLEEVVVARDELLRLQPAEEVHHALFELLAELGHVARRVDLGQGHAYLVLEPPEPGEQDGAGEEVVLAVGALDHDGQVVLGESGAGLHRVFWQRPGRGVDVFVRPEVQDPRLRAFIQGRVARGQVRSQLVEKFESRGEGFWRGPAAFGTAFDDAPCLVVVEARVVVVELDPIVVIDVAKPHGHKVLGAVSEWPIG